MNIGRDSFKIKLTAFLDGFVTPVGTVPGLVAHFAHFNAFPAATLELVWPVALSHCRRIQSSHVKSNHCLQATFSFTSITISYSVQLHL